MPGSKGRKEWQAGKMQTEEETATAEEPILEEGSGREQVRRTSLLFPVCCSHLTSAQKECSGGKVAHICVCL